MSEISLMEEFPNINVFFMTDGAENISFPYFCQCMHFGATVCVTCQALGVLNSVQLGVTHRRRKCTTVLETIELDYELSICS